MKRTILAALSVVAISCFGRAVSTAWVPGPHKHPHGVGLRCPYCGQTWDAIPRGLKAWEVRHLVSERRKLYALHLRIRHGVKK